MRCVRCLAVLLLVASPCAADKKASKEQLPAAASNNEFACDLYRELRKEGGNLFFSPYSVFTALTMTREGAAGSTAEQMDRVLRFEVSGSKGHQMLDLSTALASKGDPPDYELRVANALWGQVGMSVKRSFTDVLRDDYDAPMERVNFGRETAVRDRINGWVHKATRGRISEIVPSGLSEDTRLLLANAIYFKAHWNNRFHVRNTRGGVFHGPEGRKIPVKFMHATRTMRYGEFDGLQVVELPYRNRTTSMLVVLPEKDGMANLEETLSPREVASWMEGLSSRYVALKLPRFEVQYARDLVTPLIELDMRFAFDPHRADFGGMTEVLRLHVEAVLHKAFVAVNEQGTEAAAATVGTARSADWKGEAKPILFHADRPFVFLIRHRPTGTILFLGRLAEPKESVEEAK